MSAATSTRTRSVPAVAAPARRAYAILIGLAALAVLLQGLWAGLFIHEGQDYEQSWVGVHARGADVAIGLSIVALVVAVVKLRHRKDLVIGTAALTVLLVVESYLGGLIGGHANLTAVHLPLAMALMGLSVWLPLRARAR